jgi:hypothetical protein
MNEPIAVDEILHGSQVPCYFCGVPTILTCDVCACGLCPAHTLLRRQAWDLQGWDGVDLLCARHGVSQPGWVLEPCCHEREE